MQQLKLKELSLENFKGVEKFMVGPKGQNIRIFGDNATGKTTLFDAFTWLLFGKDSQNKKDFSIKNLDVDGNELHNLEHKVEAVFQFNEKELKLRKVYYEKWTQKRGSASKEFTGHTTDHFIDDVPSKKKEFEGKVAEIIDEDVFKLLTSPSYFNEQLHWQKRREILLQIAGDVTDEEVIQSNPRLKKLLDFLDGRSIEDHKKVIAAKRKEINRELERIPVRIDEVNQSKPDVSNLDRQNIRAEVDHLQSLIDEKEAEKHRINSGGEVTEKNKQLAEIETKMLNVRNKQADFNHNKTNGKRQELNSLIREKDELDRQISQKERAIKDNGPVIEGYEGTIVDLKDTWYQVDGEQFEEKHDDSCPTCGQSLPEEQIKAAHEKALADFNRRKAKRLEEITSRGKQLSGKVTELKNQNADFKRDIEDIRKELEQKEAAEIEIQNELQRLEAEVTDFSELPEYKNLHEEKRGIAEQIKQLKENANDSIQEVNDSIAKLRGEKQELETDLSKFDQLSKANKRISELESEQERLGGEFERLEEQLYLTEEFIRTKVNLLTSKINGRFNRARFKLFKENINGGLEETCETLFDGVPYSSGLNNAARINVGLDIISTLSEHYGIQVPIFIDNAEAVTDLINLDSQMISLVVSEPDKILRVEYTEESM
ncbi:hypothetical protein DXT76_13520, partial [Halobacillus trueperi]